MDEDCNEDGFRIEWQVKDGGRSANIGRLTEENNGGCRRTKPQNWRKGSKDAQDGLPGSDRKPPSFQPSHGYINPYDALKACLVVSYAFDLLVLLLRSPSAAVRPGRATRLRFGHLDRRKRARFAPFQTAFKALVRPNNLEPSDALPPAKLSAPARKTDTRNDGPRILLSSDDRRQVLLSFHTTSAPSSHDSHGWIGLATTIASKPSSSMATHASSASAEAGTSTSSNDVKKLPITANLMSTFKPAKVFTQYVSKGTSITSAAYDDEGYQCITSGEDDFMHIYDVRSGTRKSKLPSQKYGVHLARFTHDKFNIIYASTKENNAIRYISLKTKAYIRYFEGHENKVVSLQMSPQNDTFLSGSVEEAVRLWDLRAPKSQGHMNLRGHPVVAYDPTGKVFAVAINERSAVLLYDIRKFDQMPFLVVHLDDSAALSKVSMPPRIPIITSLAFTSDSQYLLLGTSGDVHYVIDTFSDGGQVVARLIGHEGLEKATGQSIGMVAEAGISGHEVCWTPDGKWVMSGSADGSVVFWYIDLEEAKRNEFRNLRPRYKQTGHDGVSRVLAFNPRHAQFMSAGAEVAFWLPDLPEEV